MDLESIKQFRKDQEKYQPLEYQSQMRFLMDELIQEVDRLNTLLEIKLDNMPARHGWAPGDYLITCKTCGSDYVGDKRSNMCADCAYKIPFEKQIKMSF